MKIKYRPGPAGYFVQAEGKEWGQVDRTSGFLGAVVWRVTEVRAKNVRLSGPSFRDVFFKTRQEAAETLINVQLNNAQGK